MRVTTDAGNALLGASHLRARMRWRGELADRIVQIEDEARRAFLDELIFAGAVTTPLSYNEIKEVTDRLEARYIAVARSRGEIGVDTAPGDLK